MVVVTINLNWATELPKWLWYVWLNKEIKETSLIRTLTLSSNRTKQWRDCRNIKAWKQSRLCGLAFSLKIGKWQMDIQQNMQHFLDIWPREKACKTLKKKKKMHKALRGTCEPWISPSYPRHLKGVEMPGPEQFPVRSWCMWTLWSWAVQSYWVLSYADVRSPCITPQADFCSFLRDQEAHSIS